MGTYPIDCPVCKEPFLWFSGHTGDQRCEKCKEPVDTKLKEIEMRAVGQGVDVYALAEFYRTDVPFLLSLTSKMLGLQKVAWRLMNDWNIVKHPELKEAMAELSYAVQDVDAVLGKGVRND